MGDLGPWELAAVAAEKARDLLEPGVEPVLRKQVEDLAAELAVERRQAEAAAEAAERDRRLLDRLVDIRSAEADDRGGWSTDAAYADAFREAGLDVSALSAEEAAKRIRARPPEVATALATAVDDWAAIRRDRKKDRAGAAALSALAAAADPDTWRTRPAPRPGPARPGCSPGGAPTPGQRRTVRDAGTHQPRPAGPGPQGRG